jgi:DNA modification methylase
MNILEHNKIIFGDCFELLPSITSASIDLICIDPPYEINYGGLIWDTPGIEWYKLGKEFARLLKPTGNLVMFQGYSHVNDTIQIMENNGFQLMNWIIWDRIKGRGARRNFMSTREDILWFVKSDEYTFNKIYSNIPKKTGGMGTKNGQPNRSLSNIWTDISPLVPWSKERVKHPTQKPLQLMDRIIKIFSNEGDLVLDCFAGSGSTLVSAKQLNRQFIGIEKDEDYFSLFHHRLNHTI